MMASQLLKWFQRFLEPKTKPVLPKQAALPNGVCPSCGYEFPAPPTGKRKCPSCSTQLLVRSRSKIKRFVTSEEAKHLDAEKAKLRDKRQTDLRRQHDAEWHALQKEYEYCFAAGELQGAALTQQRMARICELEGRSKDALRHWAVCFVVRINGGQRLSSYKNRSFRQIIAEKPMWDAVAAKDVFMGDSDMLSVPTFERALADGLVSEDDAKRIFSRWASQFDGLGPPVANSELAWEYMARAMKAGRASGWDSEMRLSDLWL